MATKKQTVAPSKLAWRFEPPAKPLIYREADSKYVGDEPKYPSLEEQLQWTETNYRTQLLKTLNWYNHTQDKKKSAEWLAQFLSRNPKRAKLAEHVRKGEIWPGATVGYATRAGRAGLYLRFGTLRTMLRQLKQAEVKIKLNEEPIDDGKPVVKAPNIQERMAERTSEFLGEVEGRFDTFIQNEFKGDPKLVELLTTMNVPAQQLKTVQEHINKRIEEFGELYEGKDAQLLEGYKHWGKRQMKAVVSWWSSALSDANSYNTAKKAAKAPRKKKAVSPEKIVSKLKYMKEFAELSIKSVMPATILTSTELWVYNTKTRKLGIYIVDAHQSSLSVKGTKILGYDEMASVQKTLRKPKEQLKEFTAQGKPAAKKWHKGIKTTETKLNGRINEDCILLKVYK
jgi:hypothetical protein